MEIKVENGEPQIPDDQTLPLLAQPEIQRRTLIQRAISRTFRSSAELSNLLPTGTVLAFQLLSPIFTNEGQCTSVGQTLTAGLVALCGLSCFLACFTDSFKDRDGSVCYGFATFRGLWCIDCSATLSSEISAKYKLRVMDFIHAFMSMLVFGAVALFEEDVVNCFYPNPSDKTKELLESLPVGIGVICSMLFVVFPTKRHGIGFPLTVN